MTFFTWSQTAATNATADATINYAEGQSPGSVNNSARAAMAALAKYRDDVAGVKPSNAQIETGGTTSAYTLTTNQTLTSLTNGFTVTFKVGAGLTNVAGVTLAVDGLAAKNISSVAGGSLQAGVLVAASLYTVTYHQPDDEWILHGFYGTGALSGDLDLNGFAIDFPTTANISDCLDEDNMASDSATKLATQQSIKAYADTNFLPGEAGTKALFQQTSAPTGWTKDTTHNNKAVRLSTGTVTTGGTNSFSAAFNTSGQHGMGNPTDTTAKGTDVNNAASDTHKHTFNLDVQFVDFIIATKD